ncbi:TIGR03087 family PEP-CTERM/XrtA system glycosyltransferase [Oxalobacteraceae bacterium A2-2]
MRDLLFVTHRLPYPPNKGDKIRAYHMLRYLQRHFNVHLGCFVDDGNDLQHTAQVADGCASTCFVRLHPGLARLASLRGLLNGEPLSVPYYRHGAMMRWVERTVSRHPIAAGLAYSGAMAQYLPDSLPRRVIDLVDVDSEKWCAYAACQPWPLSMLYRRESRYLLAYERQLARSVERVLLVSRAEAELFRLRAPESHHSVSHFCNGVDSDYYQCLPERPSPYGHRAQVAVFTGAMDYWPNIDAVRWFAGHVLPALRHDFPALQFHIVGARPVGAVRQLARLDGVHVSGAVPDIRPYLQHAAVAVAPLRIARGVQNKVLEAMAMQRPVVASPQALEGIAASTGHEVLCAGDEAEFVRQIGHVLRHPGAAEIGIAARQRVLRDYRWERNLERLGAMLDVRTARRALLEAVR